MHAFATVALTTRGACRYLNSLYIECPHLVQDVRFVSNGRQYGQEPAGPGRPLLDVKPGTAFSEQGWIGSKILEVHVSTNNYQLNRQNGQNKNVAH